MPQKSGKSNQPIIDHVTTYEQIRENSAFPKGRWGFMRWMLRQIFSQMKKNWWRNLIIMFVLALFFWLFNLIFLGIINDSCMFGNGRFSQNSSIAYLFGGMVYRKCAKGFDWFLGEYATTWFYNLTFYTVLGWLLSNIVRRIRARGFFAPVKDLFSISKRIKKCWISSTSPFGMRIMTMVGVGLILGFVLKSPYTLAVLAIWLLLSFGQAEQSSLIYLGFLYQGAKNVKKKKPKEVITMADVATNVLGVGIGTLLSFIISVILWNTLDYSFWARVLCFLPAGLLLIFFGMGGSIQFKGKTAKAASVVIGCLGAVALQSLRVYADDGGWSESGSNITGWLANPGTQMMELIGLGGAVGTIRGWVGNMVGGATLDHFTGGVGSAVAGVANGAMEGGNLNIGLGAYGAALGAMGPLGDMLGNAWSTAIGALAGEGQGGAEAASGSTYWGGDNSVSGSTGGDSQHVNPNPQKPEKPEDPEDGYTG